MGRCRRRSCWCTGPSPTDPAGAGSSSVCSGPGTRRSRLRTRCEVGVDAEYLASFVNQIDGPALLVGHSYGGAVISNAAMRAPNVVGLVFVAAFAPDVDERLGDLAAGSKDSLLGAAQVQRQYP